MTTHSRHDRSAYHHGDLRNALIEAAMKVLEDGGVAGLTLRGAARQAGVSHTAPYNHFGSKQGLLAAVATEGFQRLEASLASTLQEASDPRNRLRALASAYMAFALANPALYRLMFGGEIENRSQYAELIQADEATAEYAREMTADCLALSKRDPVATETAAVSAWALVHGLADLLIHEHVHLPSGRAPDAAFLSEIADLFLSALIPEDSLVEAARR